MEACFKISCANEKFYIQHILNFSTSILKHSFDFQNVVLRPHKFSQVKNWEWYVIQRQRLKGNLLANVGKYFHIVPTTMLTNLHLLSYLQKYIAILQRHKCERWHVYMFVTESRWNDWTNLNEKC